jgi:hypothetical protein
VVAVSEDVQVLVERVREALTNERVAYADWTPDALAALDALTAALDNTQKELALLEALQRYTVTQRDNAWQALERAERARDDWAERAEKAEAVVEAARFALPVLQEYSIDADEVGAQTAASQMHEAHEVLYAALAALDEPPTEQT